MPKFVYNSLFQLGKDDTKYDLVSKEAISETNFDNKFDTDNYDNFDNIILE